MDPAEDQGATAALRLAALLCARLCHDLSGPLGALIGLLEIAREEQQAAETIAVAEETATALAARLKLLRAAWGQDGEDLDLAQLQDVAGALSAGRPVRLEVSGLQAGVVFGPIAGRLLLNVLLLAAESLPGGGLITLTGSADGTILVTIAGPRAGWPQCLAELLTDKAAAFGMPSGMRDLQALLTALVTRSHGARLVLLERPVADVGPPPLLISFGTG